MKNFNLLIVVAIASLFFCPIANAAEILDDWTPYVDLGNVNFTPNGTSVDMTAEGSAGEAWGKLEKIFNHAIGMLADVKVTAVNGNGNIGIRKYLGKNQIGNWVLIELYLQIWDGRYSIRWKVREKDKDYITIRDYTSGYLGNTDGAWTVGQTYNIGFAYYDNEFIIYEPNNGAYTKVKLFEQINYISDTNCNLFIYSDAGASNNISGTVSNVNILYKNNLMSLSGAVNRKSVVIPLY